MSLKSQRNKDDALVCKSIPVEIEEEPINIVELPAKKEFFALSFSIFGVEPEISTISLFLILITGISKGVKKCGQTRYSIEFP